MRRISCARAGFGSDIAPLSGNATDFADDLWRIAKAQSKLTLDALYEIDGAGAFIEIAVCGEDSWAHVNWGRIEIYTGDRDQPARLCH